MLPHALLGLLLILGFLGRPWWTVLVAAAVLTVASLEHADEWVQQLERAGNRPLIVKSIAIIACDSLAYSSLAYLVGWLASSVIGFQQ